MLIKTTKSNFQYDANLYIMLGLSNWKMQLNLISSQIIFIVRGKDESLIIIQWHELPWVESS